MTTTIEKCPCCNADAVDRSEFWEAYPENGRVLAEQVAKVRMAVKRYYLALDDRKHGGVAMDKAIREIEETLGLFWRQGETRNFLEAHPKLKPIYER